jgi:hypothetical protein
MVRLPFLAAEKANRVFEIGEAVRKVVMKAKSIDAARRDPINGRGVQPG